MLRPRLRLSALGLVMVCVVVACRKAPEPQADPRPATESSMMPLSQQQRAVNAREALFAQLSQALMAAMSSGGPAAAVEVCQRQAPRLAERVGREHQLRIGRTGVRLRNPQNRPPEWAAEFVAHGETEQQFVNLADGSLGALLPIRLNAECLACHGPADQIAQEVLGALDRLYPDDEATGFRVGDLRGWFWVEVPAT